MHKSISNLKVVFIIISSFLFLNCSSKGQGPGSTRDGSGDVRACRAECHRDRLSERVIEQCEKMCGRTYFD